MEEKAMMANGVTTSSATAPPQASASGADAQRRRNRQDTQMHAESKEEEEQKEDDDDMPLLFMDRLPSDFATNEQLAAIATFMEDSDTEQQQGDEDGNGDSVDHSGDAERHTTRGLTRQAVRRRSARRRRKQAPYAKEKKRDTTSANDLALFMNLFKM